MNSIILSSRIRKLIIGDAKSGMQYVVGNKAGPRDNKNLTITRIVLDQNAYYKFGTLKYIVYVQRDEDNYDRIWKWFDDQPVAVEVFVDEDLEINVPEVE